MRRRSLPTGRRGGFAYIAAIVFLVVLAGVALAGRPPSKVMRAVFTARSAVCTTSMVMLSRRNAVPVMGMSSSVSRMRPFRVLGPLVGRPKP